MSDTLLAPGPAPTDYARIVDELQRRTRDLQEALEHQAATNDVLRVISQSGTDIDPVLRMLVETAATVGYSTQFREYFTHHPGVLQRATVSGRARLERRIVHIEDAWSDPEYSREMARLGPIR